MKSSAYDALATPFKDHPKRLAALRWTNRISTASIYVLYISILIYLLVYTKWTALLWATAVPATGLVFVSVWRRIANVPRRYEVTGEPSLLGKDSKGESFPSRHVFCAALIGVTALRLSVPAGIAALAVTVLIAAVRVVGGAHYLRDVVVGAIAGTAWGVIGFWLLPLWLT